MMANILPLLIVALLATDALAQSAASTGSRGPFDVALLATYAWVFAVSAIGGLAAWAKKVRAGQARAFNVAELLGELFISAFAGVVTFWFCRWAQLNEWVTAAFIGIAGHMGSRAIFLGEQALERFFGRINPNTGGKQ